MNIERLSQGQTYGLIGFGGVFWGMAALAVRHAGYYLLANNQRRVSVFIAIIPVSYAAMALSEAVLSIHSKQRLLSVTIMTTTALLLDGAAMMWFPALYEDPVMRNKNPASAVAFSRMGAAWILWGAGIGLGIALLTY